MSNPSQSEARHLNRLARETSPYLLQHRHNPVDWYPWGPEAFAAAKRENKPLFLSVGYSTCYWCHVMERQSFENEGVAAEMNARFINVKVDREERPDVDQLYMTAVQVMTRQGGWPMSVFLTPELRPFYAGTYFPPTDQYGRPGFTTLLRALDDAWQTRRDDVEKSAAQLVNVLEQLAAPKPPSSPVPFDQPLFDEIIERSTSDFDSKHGGFGGAPKFPRETLLELLLYRQGTAPDAKLGGIIDQTLEALARGGIRDQLGGGFHRYSTDAMWLVPHFEIMLYDNAMLGFCYAEAYRQTRRPQWASIARGIFDFILREMTSPAGAFYTALDAEVDSQEGKNYLWTAEEIREVLGEEDAQFFGAVYGVDQGPNFADPHHGSGTPDRNILFLPRPLSEAASLAGLTEDALQEKLEPMRAKLYARRATRKQPLLDTKILTSWNALMIRALAHGGAVLEEPAYIEAAGRAADFLLNAHAAPDGALLRASGGGLEKVADHDAREASAVSTPDAVHPDASPDSNSEAAPASAAIPGCLDDYAFLAQALLALHRAGHEDKRRTQAQQIAEQMLRRFADERSGGFFFTDAAAAAELIVRQKVAGDSPLPSGNAVAADVLIDLGRWREARGAIAVFAETLTVQSEGMSALVQAAMKFVAAQGPFTVAAGGAAQAADRPQSPEQQAAGIVGVGIAWRSARELTVSLDIRDGFHISANVANTTTSDGIRLLPTIVAMADEPAAAIVYPEPVMESVPIAGQEIAIYRGKIHVDINLGRDIEKGQPLRLTVAYQACSENACLPPVRRQISISR